MNSGYQTCFYLVQKMICISYLNYSSHGLAYPV